MTKATRRRPADEAGGAVIDWLAGAMILAILFGIALPAFFGFHRAAQDRAAQDAIESVLGARGSLWPEPGEHAESGALAGPETAPVIDGSDPAAGVTITLNSSARTLCVERASASGETFGVWQSPEQDTLYGRGGGLTGACPAVAPAGYTPGGW